MKRGDVVDFVAMSLNLLFGRKTTNWLTIHLLTDRS